MADHCGYDVVVVGAGPAGLSAARTTARLGFRTLVLERQPAVGQLCPTSNGLLTPLTGFVGAEPVSGGLRYNELNLTVPAELIAGFPPVQRYLSPSGRKLESLLGCYDASPVVAVDKTGLLQLLADQAVQAGAELRFGANAQGLLRAGRQIIGLRTSECEVRADVLIAAEGPGGELCEEAEMYSRTATDERYAVTLHQDLVAPQVGREDLGHFLTFGKRYTSAPQAFGTVLAAAPGRASVSFTVFSDRPRHHTDPALWAYLDEFTAGDRRISQLLRGSEIISRTGSQRTVRSNAVERVISDGFMAVGDAVAPSGQIGILPALYLGRQAALLAAAAVEAGDTSATGLAPYDEFLRTRILPDLERENRALLALTAMTDDEIDRLFNLLTLLQRSEPYFTSWEMLPWTAARWLAGRAQVAADEARLLARLVGIDEVPAAVPGTAWPSAAIPFERASLAARR